MDDIHMYGDISSDTSPVGPTLEITHDTIYFYGHAIANMILLHEGKLLTAFKERIKAVDRP